MYRYRWGEYLGLIEVSFDTDGKIVSYEGAPIHMTNTTTQDPHLESQIKEWAAPFAAYSATVVGSTAVDLIQSTCQTQECTLGNVIADAALWFRKNVTNAVDAAIVNAGGIRTGIPTGNVTIGDVLTAFPFGNSVTDIPLTGAQLWKSVEGIVSRVNQWNGQKVTSFLQVSSNLRLSYNPNGNAGSQLVSLEINGKPIGPDDVTSYNIVTWDFLAGGGDNFWPQQSGYAVLDTQDEVLVDYLGQFSPVNITLDGRISTTGASS